MESLVEDVAVPFQGIWLDAPRDVLEPRILARRGDASDAYIIVLRRQLERGFTEMTWA